MKLFVGSPKQSVERFGDEPFSSVSIAMPVITTQNETNMEPYQVDCSSGDSFD